MKLETIRIADPNKDGDYITINADDFDPDTHVVFGEKPAPITRESIMEMSKDDVAELLEAHGVDVDKRRALDTLRAELIQVMFV